VAAVANAALEPHVDPVFQGYLSDGTTHVYSFDMMVNVSGDDRWQVAGGPWVGAPWITLTNAVFYQDPMGGDTQPDPALFGDWPDTAYDTFYTTHLGWPNTPERGPAPSFAVGPINQPAQLIADWFQIPDGNCYPGDFTIARFTVVAPPDADPSVTYAEIDMLIGSLEVLECMAFQAHIPIPEPASLGLLALGSLALLRRR